MKDKIKALLQKLGVDNDTITKLTSDKKEDIDSVDVDALETSVKENYKNALTNDSSFIDPIHSAAKGKIASTLENKMAAEFGITKEEFATLPTKDRFEALIKMSKGKIESGKGTPDDKDKAIEQLNKKILSYETKITDLNENEIPRIKGEYEGKMKQVEYMNILGDELGKHKLILGRKVAIVTVDLLLREQADVVIENGLPVLKERGKDVKLFKNNKEVTFDTLVKEIVDREKLVQLSNAGEPPKGGKAKNLGSGEDGTENVLSLPGAEKAKQRNAEFKAKLEKK